LTSFGAARKGSLAACALCFVPHSGTLLGYQLRAEVPAPREYLERENDREGGLIGDDGIGYGYGPSPYVGPRYGYGYGPRPYVGPRYGYGYGPRPYVGPRYGAGYGPAVPNRGYYSGPRSAYAAAPPPRPRAAVPYRAGRCVGRHSRGGSLRSPLAAPAADDRLTRKCGSVSAYQVKGPQEHAVVSIPPR
jgi:hypothetical protein